MPQDHQESCQDPTARLTLEVRQRGAQYRIDRSGISKIVRFNHVDQKMDRYAVATFRRKNAVEGRPVPREGLMMLFSSFMFQIIHQNHK